MTEGNASKGVVLFLLHEYFPKFSGHGVYLKRLFPLIQQQGYQVKVLTFVDSKEEQGSTFVDGVEVFRIIQNYKGLKNRLASMTLLLATLFNMRKQFDILHFSGHMDIFGLMTLLCKCLKKKVIMQMVLLGTDDPETIANTYKLMSARFVLLRRLDCVMYISDAFEEPCLKHGFPKKRLRLVRQGVDTQTFHPMEPETRAELRMTLGYQRDQAVVLFVGAIIERKGVDILLEAWRKVQSDYSEAKLVLAGPDSFQSQELNDFVHSLKKDITQYELNVDFLGTRNDVEKLMAIADVFVLPSRKEGFGNVIIEAMSCETPVVVTHMDGVSLQSVSPGSNGFIVHDAPELARQLSVLLENDDLREEMGSKARDSVRENFSFESVVKDFTNVYDDLMN